MLRYRVNIEPPWHPSDEARAVAREHVAWARRASFTPSEILDAIGAPPRWFEQPTWADVELAVARAWSGVAPAARVRDAG